GFVTPSLGSASLLPLVDLHHAVLGFHHQFLRGEVFDVQGDLPRLLGLFDLRHAGAELLGEGAGVSCCPGLGHQGALGHHGGQEPGNGHVRAQVAGPVGAGKGGELLCEGGHAEGLVEEPVALVPVAEGVPAGGPEQAEGDASLCHGGWRKRSGRGAVEEQ
uniref:Uncharacterized protein n=1 Tax=Esox lucius TaxID=8010 RepID=A0A3P8YXG8_ESOLU